MVGRKIRGENFKFKRNQRAEANLDALTKKYMEEGLSKDDAQAQAMKDLRDNPRGDWRAS